MDSKNKIPTNCHNCEYGQYNGAVCMHPKKTAGIIVNHYNNKEIHPECPYKEIIKMQNKLKQL